MKVKPDYMVVAVQVRKDHVARLDKIGKESGVPRSILVREAIAEYLSGREALI
jgi:predicted transcriptional regulator